MATATGGRYFRATDADSLRDIYETIDKLEKSSIEETKQVRYRELAVDGFTVDLRVLPPFRLPSLLAIALILLAIDTIVTSTRLRTLA